MTSLKCPSCGENKLELKKISHLVNGGNNTAIIDLNIEACHKCGEILFTEEQVRLIEEVKEKLEKNKTENFIPIGKNFRVA